MKNILRFIFITSLIIHFGCKKDNSTTLKNLHQIYENGEIDRCKYKGSVVYVASLNVYDGGAVIYDYNGNKIGGCNYAWGKVDVMCEELKKCEVIYRCENHITGQPPVNKYDL